MSSSRGKRKSDGSPSQETELDVQLPDKIALTHDVDSLEFSDRDTLQKVPLPDRDQLKGGRPRIAPILEPMMAEENEADRATELVDVAVTSEHRRASPRATRRAPHPAVLILIGAAFGSAATLLVVWLLS